MIWYLCEGMAYGFGLIVLGVMLVALVNGIFPGLSNSNILKEVYRILFEITDDVNEVYETD